MLLNAFLVKLAVNSRLLKYKDMISGKARELFLKWFREEKQLTDFEERPILTQIFALCEWLKTQGYAISTKSNYYVNSFVTAMV